MMPIAYIRTDFSEKFGTPRQSGLAKDARGCICFYSEYSLADAVRGLEGFSHIWLIWRFDNTRCDAIRQEGALKNQDSLGGEDTQLSCEDAQTQWRPLVRPPRLGGNEKLGVFATRSPFRPNNLGLSVVALDSVRYSNKGPELLVSGVDLMNQTEIFDIKPYIPESDCIIRAKGGFTDDNPWSPLAVEIPPMLAARIPHHALDGLIQALSLDPRPATQHGVNRTYGLLYAGRDVRFCVSDKEGVVRVIEVN